MREPQERTSRQLPKDPPSAKTCKYSNIYAVNCNLTELTTRSTSFTRAVSGLLDMCMRQGSSCSSSIAHCSSFVGVLVSVFLSVGTPWGLSPLPYPSLSFHCFISVTGTFFFLLPHGCSWLGCLDLPAMGAVSI